VLFSFAKTGPALYLGHLDVLGIFERAFLRARYQPVFTEGFNPKPRLEFAQALSLGIASQEEIALVTLADFDAPEAFRLRLNRALPEGLQVLRAKALPPHRVGTKKHSPMALYWGADYLLRGTASGIAAARRELAAAEGIEVLPGTASGEVLVRVPATAKPANILKLLGPAAREVEASRQGCYASGPEGAPVSYFELDLPS
jgi:radical SAM-linked protein